MIIEHRVFRLAEGVAVDEFLDADRRVQDEVAVFRPGFVRRTTARGADGRWLVETLWDGEQNAIAAASDDHAAVVRFESLLDADSVRVERFETLDR